MQNLKGKIALVTGASRGLGRGIASDLAQSGAEVIINYHNDSSLTHVESLIKDIEAIGGKAFPIQADVSKKEYVDNMFETIKKRYGRLDILINNAGVSQSKDIFEITEEDWNFIINTNLKSSYLCSQKAMEMMREQKNGRIIFVSSMVAHQGAIYGHMHYAATKAGQLGMMKTLARTGAPLGITVNAIAPGIIDTELLRHIHGDEGVKKLSATVPLGLGNVKDVGNVVTFLCSDESHYLTGINIDINGGMYIH